MKFNSARRCRKSTFERKIINNAFKKNSQCEGNKKARDLLTTRVGVLCSGGCAFGWLAHCAPCQVLGCLLFEANVEKIIKLGKAFID